MSTGSPEMARSLQGMTSTFGQSFVAHILSSVSKQPTETAKSLITTKQWCVNLSNLEKKEPEPTWWTVALQVHTSSFCTYRDSLRSHWTHCRLTLLTFTPASDIPSLPAATCCLPPIVRYPPWDIIAHFQKTFFHELIQSHLPKLEIWGILLVLGFPSVLLKLLLLMKNWILWMERAVFFYYYYFFRFVSLSLTKTLTFRCFSWFLHIKFVILLSRMPLSYFSSFFFKWAFRFT